MTKAKEYRQAAIIFVLMILVFFWPLIKGRILSQADVLHFFPPWIVQKPPDLMIPSNAVLGDQTREFLTFFQVAKESLHRMEFPLWNPYIMAGTPLLANSQSALFSAKLALLLSAPFSWFYGECSAQDVYCQHGDLRFRQETFSLSFLIGPSRSDLYVFHF